MRKLLHEKRLELYMSFYEQVERCLKNRQIVFEQEYFQKIGTYKAKMTLMASENTRKAFDEFFWFIRQKWTDYHKYSLKMILRSTKVATIRHMMKMETNRNG